MLHMWKGLNIQLHSFLLLLLPPEVCEKWSLVWIGEGCCKTVYSHTSNEDIIPQSTWIEKSGKVGGRRGEDKGRKCPRFKVPRLCLDPQATEAASALGYRRWTEQLCLPTSSIFYSRDYEILYTHCIRWMLKWKLHQLALNWHFGHSSK